ncbi:hypothetical protein FKW77_000749 [Venturia effusa]|uniref:SGNH hydrolase-type esterase domain-containing protein n=1 Tax=Venturia effusa TaxID=50376 RepID=A0A517LQJ1_9PEZI|nr:hypothetical protein FKW77_000749 [Venturia effusa]
MNPILSLLSFSLAVGVLAAPKAATPKLLICSDSTTANYNPSSQVLQGWGYHIADYLSIPVVNLAVNGRSTRSFINEGKWQALLNRSVAGDFILTEMGHNDDSDPWKNTKYVERGTLPGLGNSSKPIALPSGKTEIVHTFGWYLESMIADVRKVKGIPLISGMVPRNYWTGDTFRATWPFTETARQVAAAAKIEFIDHTKYSAAALQKLGPTGAKKLFPNDNTHTDDAGAHLNAESFVIAAVCAKSPLADYLSAKGKAIKASC